ncbi:MAG: hypothetical protein RLY93_15655 [Sumerlaeia bacterium]
MSAPRPVSPPQQAYIPRDEPRRSVSGKKTLIAVAIAACLFVPLLVAGPTFQRDIDLTTLRQRTQSGFTIMNAPVGEPAREVEDAWPEPSGDFHIPPPFDSPHASTPMAYWQALGRVDDPPESERWVTRRYTSPVLFVIPLTNPNALHPFDRARLDTRLIAAAVLDPGDPADRALYEEVEAALADVTPAPKPDTGAPEKRRARKPTLGDLRAQAFVEDFLTILSQDAPEAERLSAVREALRLLPDNPAVR